MKRGIATAATLWLSVAGCGDDGGTSDATTGSTGTPATSITPSTGPASSSGAATTAASSSGADSSGGPADSTSTGDATDSTGAAGDTSAPPLQFVAVTFNTGGHADGQEDVADDHYGNGLAWIPAVQQTTAWFAALTAPLAADSLAAPPDSSHRSSND